VTVKRPATVEARPAAGLKVRWLKRATTTGTKTVPTSMVAMKTQAETMEVKKRAKTTDTTQAAKMAQRVRRRRDASEMDGFTRGR